MLPDFKEIADREVRRSTPAVLLLNSPKRDENYIYFPPYINYGRKDYYTFRRSVCPVDSTRTLEEQLIVYSDAECVTTLSTLRPKQLHDRYPIC